MKLTQLEKEKLGTRIKNIRLKKGMTTKEFGSLLGATDSNVTSWEKGRTSPNPERLKTIAKIADISVEELLYGNILRHYFNEHWTQLIKNEDTAKDYYNINQKEFEYVQSSKEKVYDNFYNNALEYGYSDNNNDNFYLFALAVTTLLSKYYTLQINDNHSRATVLKTASKAIEQITLTAGNAIKQTTNVDDKMFYLKLVEITEEYAMKMDKLFKTIRHNDESTL